MAALGSVTIRTVVVYLLWSCIPHAESWGTRSWGRKEVILCNHSLPYSLFWCVTIVLPLAISSVHLPRRLLLDRFKSLLLLACKNRRCFTKRRNHWWHHKTTPVFSGYVIVRLVKLTEAGRGGQGREEMYLSNTVILQSVITSDVGAFPAPSWTCVHLYLQLREKTCGGGGGGVNCAKLMV